MHPIGAEHHEVDLPFRATTVVMNSQAKRHSEGLLGHQRHRAGAPYEDRRPRAWQRCELPRLADMITP